MRRGIAIVALVIVALAPMLGRAASAGLVFSQSVASPHELSGEPSLATDPTIANKIYYIAPGMSKLAVSDDGGATFSLAGAVQTSGDADVAVDKAGNVYVSALTDDTLNSVIPVSTSTDHGVSFSRVVNLYPNASGVACDRQWTAAYQAGHVVTSARCGSTYRAWVSKDAGVSFVGPKTIATGVTRGGPLQYSPDGSTLWSAYQVSGGLRWAKSGDEGLTWTTGVIATASCCTLFTVLDVDAANNLYVVWSTTSEMVQFSKSVNGGATWSTPVTLSDKVASADLGSTTSAVFPWVTAGALGKVAVSWYEARQTVGGKDADLGSDFGLPTTHWDVVVAQSLNANAATPVWTKDTAVSDFHVGSICTFGLLCVGPQNAGVGNVPTALDRRDLDFFETALDSNGNLLIAYPADRPVTGGYRWDPILSVVDLKVARQTAGPKIK